VLATYLFLLFLSGILQYSYAKGCGRFLEQSRLGLAFSPQKGENLYVFLFQPKNRVILRNAFRKQNALN
jgi:hypothetical protein